MSCAGCIPSPRKRAAQCEQSDSDPEYVYSYRRHRTMMERIDEHQRPAGDVEGLIGNAVAGQPPRGDEAIGQQQRGRADPAADFDQYFHGSVQHLFVYIAPMPHPDNRHLLFRIIYLIDHTVIAHTNSPAFHGPLELAHPRWARILS